MDRAAKGVLIGCGALAAVAVAGILGVVLRWRAVSPGPEARTIRAAQGGAAGDPSGAQVTVPAGAVERDVRISLTPKPPESREVPGTNLVGRVWDVRVDGQERFQFKKPVLLSMPFDRSLATGPVSLSRWEDGRWQPVRGSQVDGDRVSAEVDHFCEFAPCQDGAPAKEPAGTVPEWFGQVDLQVSGHWGHQDSTSSSDWTVSRDGCVRFHAVQRVRIPGDRQTWTTTREDPPAFEGNVSDGGFRTDNDYRKSGNVFYRRFSDGRGKASGTSLLLLTIDSKAGTYQVSGNATVGTVTTTSKTEPATSGGHKPVTNPLTVSFAIGPRPLPKTDGALRETIEVPTKDLSGLIGGSEVTLDDLKHVRGTMSVTLTPKPKTLVARIRGALAVRRGDGAAFDGSASTGDIVEYRWTFEPLEGPLGPTAPSSLSDVAIKVTALRNFRVKLEVRDKNGDRDQTERDIRVDARTGPEWQMKFSKSVTPAPPLASRLNAGAPDWASTLHLGINECAKHPDSTDAGHVIHTSTKTPGTWLGEGYEVMKIADGEGPFAGTWFVLRQSLEVVRREMLNPELRSKIPDLNNRHGNLPPALDLRQEVTDHEYWHTQLMREKWDELRKSGKDPSAAIEKLIGARKDDLQQEADGAIRPIETELTEAYAEKNVKARLGKEPRYKAEAWVWFPAKQLIPGTPAKTKYEESDFAETERQVNMGVLADIGDDYTVKPMEEKK